MKKNVVQKIHVLVGLPGSGKTTFANSLRDNNTCVINMDECLPKKSSHEYIKAYINRNLYVPGKLMNVVLDGLFTSDKDIVWVLNIVVNRLNERGHSIMGVTIDYWNPNKYRENCLWNDIGRRIISSAETIKHLDIPVPNVKEIEDKLDMPVKLEYHAVKRKPEYLVFAANNKIGLEKDRYLVSNTWSLGGEGWGYNSKQSWHIDAEQPVEFDEFDKLLEDIAPQITFLQYKKLWKECVKILEKGSGDYYSNVTLAYYACDLEKLYSTLVDWNFVTPLVDNK